MKEPEEIRRLQRQFAVGHAAFIFVVFLPPLALALRLGLSPDVLFFADRGLLLLLTAAVLGLIFPFMHVCFRPTNRFMLVSVWLPALTFFFVGFMYRYRTSAATAALRHPSCFDDPAKKGLEKAYRAADELYGVCMAWRPPPTGAPAAVDSIAECPDYHSALRLWGREFNYLATLERRFPCGGVCYAGRRLWVDPGTYGAACSPFAAQWMSSAHVQATILLGYSIFVMVVLIPSHIVCLSPLVRRYDEELLASPYPF